MRFAPWAIILAALIAPAACSSSDESTNSTDATTIATVATTAPATTLAPTTTAATTTTTAPSTTLPTITTPTTTSRVVPRPAELTVEEFEVYTTNYNQLLDTIEASQEAWLAFTHDPFNDELADAYLSYHIEPMLTAVHQGIEEHRVNNYFTELSGREAFAIDPLSVEFDDDYTEAVALACETDGVRFFQTQADGTSVLLNDNLSYTRWSYGLVKQNDKWMISTRTRNEEANEVPCA
ncbi:MAG: hypothetical protein CSA55_04935 [Ilumatobacter coccineus]|uniref:SnoaL-like domain-containing protein n=1 Tax=Ilumatobacter coccineus TaxID=467094 RepID=A0A2G6K9W8_9ACTN|nr:MAG: hypothetical protein CSA55_04935 [Ilumatobacter coccineus]